MLEPQPSRPRWYHLTPDRLLVVLLPILGLLFLSEPFRWFPFNEHKNWTVLIAVAVVCLAVVLLLLWLGVSLVSRLRFQFSIRSMLLFVAVVAVVCSWFTVKIRQARRQQAAVKAIDDRGGRVFYDYEMVNGSYAPSANSWVPEWLLGKLGEDFFHRVVALKFYLLRPSGCDEWRLDASVHEGWSRFSQLDSDELVRLGLLKLISSGRHIETVFACRRAIELDPHHVDAHLLLAEWLSGFEVYDPRNRGRPHLKAVIRHADPNSLEFAHAQKLLAKEPWTFEELCQHVGEDGVLR